MSRIDAIQAQQFRWQDMHMAKIYKMQSGIAPSIAFKYALRCGRH